MPKGLKKEKPPPPPSSNGAAYGNATAPPNIGVPPVNLVSNVVPLPVTPPSDNLDPLNANGSESSEEEEDDPVSSSDKEDSDDGKEHSDYKEFSTNVGPESYIFKKIKQVDDLDECAAILALTTARFKYLNLQNCICGKRLTKNYLESRTCFTCTRAENKKKIPMCGNCDVVSLTGKYLEIGFCRTCSNAELMKMRLFKK